MYKLMNLSIKNIIIFEPTDLLDKETYLKLNKEERREYINKRSSLTYNDFSLSIPQRNEIPNAELIIFIDNENLDEAIVIKIGILRKTKIYGYHKGKDILGLQILKSEKNLSTAIVAKSLALRDIEK